MSDRFNGFSQEEINKVAKAPLYRGQHVGIRRMPDKWSRQPTATEQNRRQQVNKRSTPTPTQTPPMTAKSDTGVTINASPAMEPEPELNLERSMSKSIEEALFYQPMKQLVMPAQERHDQPHNTKPVATTPLNGQTAPADSSDADDSSILKLPTTDTNVSSSALEHDDSSIMQATPHVGSMGVDSPFKGISLKDFEVHRKMIEEQNKQKKELLYKAIEHHSRKTAAEARKIEDIKSELAKLDNDLAVDVAILRKQIDNACVHFANVEKHYMKIEAQFLKAKLELHNAAEKKELLTEHLCTVIAHNEDHKAQKLSELMEKVGLTQADDAAGDCEPTTTTTTTDAGANK